MTLLRYVHTMSKCAFEGEFVIIQFPFLYLLYPRVCLQFQFQVLAFFFFFFFFFFFALVHCFLCVGHCVLWHSTLQ